MIAISSRNDLLKQQFECKNAWKESLAATENLCKDYLREKAEKAQYERNTSLESALKHIINAETVRALHRRQGAVVRGSHPGSLTKILVPIPDSSKEAPSAGSKRCDAWESINHDKIINSLFCTLNKKKLCMALGSDFAPGGIMHNLVGEDGCSEIADMLLDGSFDRSSLRVHNRSDIDTLMVFVRHMARPRKDDGSPLPDMEWTYGAKEYCQSFSKKSEVTS